MPEMPAPTMSTSKCSARVASSRAAVAGAVMGVSSECREYRLRATRPGVQLVWFKRILLRARSLSGSARHAVRLRAASPSLALKVRRSLFEEDCEGFGRVRGAERFHKRGDAGSDAVVDTCAFGPAADERLLQPQRLWIKAGDAGSKLVCRGFQFAGGRHARHQPD